MSFTSGEVEKSMIKIPSLECYFLVVNDDFSVRKGDKGILGVIIQPQIRLHFRFLKASARADGPSGEMPKC